MRKHTTFEIRITARCLKYSEQIFTINDSIRIYKRNTERKTFREALEELGKSKCIIFSIKRNKHIPIVISLQDILDDCSYVDIKCYLK